MQRLRADIDQAGGLYSRAGLARRWGVSKSYISEATARPDFPAPITTIDGHDGREVWAGVDADAWRDMRRKPGRPSSKGP